MIQQEEQARIIHKKMVRAYSVGMAGGVTIAWAMIILNDLQIPWYWRWGLIILSVVIVTVLSAIWLACTGNSPSSREKP